MACLGFKFQETATRRHMKMLRLGVTTQQKQSKLQFLSLYFEILTTQPWSHMPGTGWKPLLFFFSWLNCRKVVWVGFFPSSSLFPLWLTLREQKVTTKIKSQSSEGDFSSCNTLHPLEVLLFLHQAHRTVSLAYSWIKVLLGCSWELAFSVCAQGTNCPPKTGQNLRSQEAGEEPDVL